MLWISGTSAYVDVDGNGTYQPGTDYLVTETGNTISVTRTVTPSGTVESQSVGYRMILQSPLVQNPDATGDFAIAATLSSDCLSAWNGSAIETIEPQGSGCAPPDTLKDVGSTVRVTKSGSSFTIAWSPDPAPVSCMEGYVVLASSDCRAFSAFAPLATVDKNTAQVGAAGTGLNVTYFLVAEVGQGGEIGPTGWVAP